MKVRLREKLPSTVRHRVCTFLFPRLHTVPRQHAGYTDERSGGLRNVRLSYQLNLIKAPLTGFPTKSVECYPIRGDATVHIFHQVQGYLGSSPRKTHHLHDVSGVGLVRGETRRVTVLRPSRGPEVSNLESTNKPIEDDSGHLVS